MCIEFRGVNHSRSRLAGSLTLSPWKNKGCLASLPLSHSLGSGVTECDVTGSNGTVLPTLREPAIPPLDTLLTPAEEGVFDLRSAADFRFGKFVNFVFSPSTCRSNGTHEWVNFFFRLDVTHPRMINDNYEMCEPFGNPR